MKTIMAYGDSNTWGAIPKPVPGPATRYGPETRWTGVMRTALGDGFTVIAEGLNGRTTVHDDPVEGLHKNGRTYLVPCLESHAPLDLVVIKLGTNDLKARFGLGAFDIAAGAGALLDIVMADGKYQPDGPPKALLIAPAPLARLDRHGEMFVGGAETSRHLASHYAAVAAERGAAFLNAGDHIRSSDIDGIHLEADQHRALGLAAAEKVREMLAGD